MREGEPGRHVPVHDRSAARGRRGSVRPHVAARGGAHGAEGRSRADVAPGGPGHLAGPQHAGPERGRGPRRVGALLLALAVLAAAGTAGRSLLSREGGSADERAVPAVPAPGAPQAAAREPAPRTAGELRLLLQRELSLRGALLVRLARAEAEGDREQAGPLHEALRAVTQRSDAALVGWADGATRAGVRRALAEQADALSRQAAALRTGSAATGPRRAVAEAGDRLGALLAGGDAALRSALRDDAVRVADLVPALARGDEEGVVRLGGASYAAAGPVARSLAVVLAQRRGTASPQVGSARRELEARLAALLGHDAVLLTDLARARLEGPAGASALARAVADNDAALRSELVARAVPRADETVAAWTGSRRAALRYVDAVAGDDPARERAALLALRRSAAQVAADLAGTATGPTVAPPAPAPSAPPASAPPVSAPPVSEPPGSAPAVPADVPARLQAQVALFVGQVQGLAARDERSAAALATDAHRGAVALAGALAPLLERVPDPGSGTTG